MFNRERQFIHLFHACWYKENVQIRMQEYGLAFLGQTQASAEDTKLETIWELRTGVALRFNALYHEETPIEVIETMAVEATVIPPEENPVESILIVPPPP